ncbi:MAG TPA: DUF1080 domain-containing protein [Niastella sp.]
MRILTVVLTITGCLLAGMAMAQKKSNEWISLFDGKSLNEWKVGENASTFTVDSGRIIAHGPVAHLFYNGNALNHNFKNFHFKAEVMTTPGSNSGIYFHTTFQEGGWPSKGYEVQVNNSHTDWRRTGSLYAVDDVKDVLVKDNVWFTEEIIVQGKKVTVKVNGKVVVEYTEPDNAERSDDMGGRKLSSGTFALQGHDPNSKVYFRNLQVKALQP